MIAAGQPVHIADLAADPEFAVPGAVTTGKARTGLGVPLLRQGEPIGAIVLSRTRLEPFTERQIDHQAATIDVLKQMSTSPGDAQPVFDLICHQARALLGSPVVGLFEYDGTLVHRRTVIRTADPADPAARAAYEAGWPRVPDRGSLSCRAILDATIIHIHDMGAEPGVSTEVRALGNKTQVSIPLMRDGRAIGAITTSSPRVGGFTDSQVALLQTFAEQAVIAIQSAETWRELQARTRELEESLEYQTATSDVLKVISRSTSDVQPVLDTVVETNWCAPLPTRRSSQSRMRGSSANCRPARLNWPNAIPRSPSASERLVTLGGTLGEHLLERRNPLAQINVRVVGHAFLPPRCTRRYASASGTASKSV